MSRMLFISHPEVIVDPTIDIRNWRLSLTGRSRMLEFAKAPLPEEVRSVWSSAETKALEAATILADQLGTTVRIDGDLGENDRSATGFLPPDEFEHTADAFFAQPLTSIRGWERAIDAQQRVASAVDRILMHDIQGDIAIVAHGAVGTLLLCKWRGRQVISRTADQPFQGHYWAASLPSRRVLHVWRPIAPR